MAIQPGTHLGPYEILSAIGAGGMGEVYRARDSTLSNWLAELKMAPGTKTGPFGHAPREQR